MGTYNADLFMSLDGYGSSPVAYWGKGGPELDAARRRAFFAGEGDEVLVLGATTYREMAGFADRFADEPDFAALTARRKVVVSRTLAAPLDWAGCELLAGDALDVVPALKASTDAPLRSHGSLAMNRALLAAGLVDRLEVTIFPMVCGASGSDPLFAGLPDVDLELVDHRVLDGRIQQLTYVPTVLEVPLGG